MVFLFDFYVAVVHWEFTCMLHSWSHVSVSNGGMEVDAYMYETKRDKQHAATINDNNLERENFMANEYQKARKLVEHDRIESVRA